MTIEASIRSVRGNQNDGKKANNDTTMTTPTTILGAALVISLLVGITTLYTGSTIYGTRSLTTAIIPDGKMQTTIDYFFDDPLQQHDIDDNLMCGNVSDNLGTKHHIQASDGVTIGYRVLKESSSPTQGSSTFSSSNEVITVMILPGWTLTATQFICWFGPALTKAIPNIRIIAMDYRGLGLSQGKLMPSTSPNVSDSGNVYTGLRMSRIATDVSEVLNEVTFDPSKTVLLGHSFGNAILYEYLSLFASHMYRGFAIIDQMPKYHVKPSAADATFTDRGNVWREKEWDATAMVNTLSTQTIDFHKTPIQANLKVTGAPPSARYNYPEMAHYFASFKSWEHCETVQQIPGSSVAEFDQGCLNNTSCCVTQTENGMKAWAAGTHDFTDMNGKMDALVMWSNGSTDYTDVMSLIRKNTLPVFVYGGEHSASPVESMHWTWNNTGARIPKSKKLIFYGSEGVHTPFLNKKQSRDRFFNELTEWILSL